MTHPAPSEDEDGSDDQPDGAFAGPSAGVAEEDLDDVVRRRAPPRQRMVRTALVLVALVVMVGLLVRGSARMPTPQLPLMDAQEGPVVLVSNVNFGTVTLNGQRVVGTPPLILPLSAGTNLVALNAPPFLPHRCAIKANGDVLPGEDCVASGLYVSVTVGNTTVHPSRVIVLPLTGADLPGPLEQQAEATVNQALAEAAQSPLFSVRVLPGEVVGAGTAWPAAILSQPATEAGLARVRFGLFAPTDGTVRSHPCPFALCAGAAITDDAPVDAGPRWNVVADSYFEWDFSATPVASLSYAALPLIPEPAFPLTYQATSGWRVDILPAEADRPLTDILAGDICGAGVFALRANAQSLEDQVVVLQDRGVGGCELELRSNATGTSDGVYLWRFGVLSAADANAHTTLPEVPVAPEVELEQFAAAPG